MSSFSRSNNGYTLLLAVIDVYSTYGWIVPLKTKTGKEVAAALAKLFEIAVDRLGDGILQSTLRKTKKNPV